MAMEGEVFKIPLWRIQSCFLPKSPYSIPVTYHKKLRQQRQIYNYVKLCGFVKTQQIATVAEKDTNLLSQKKQSQTLQQMKLTFSVMDAKKGYHQCLMDEPSKL